MEAASLRYPGLNLFVGLTVAMGVSSVEGVKRGTSARDRDVSKLPEFVILRSQTEFTDRCPYLSTSQYHVRLYIAQSVVAFLSL